VFAHTTQPEKLFIRQPCIDAINQKLWQIAPYLVIHFMLCFMQSMQEEIDLKNQSKQINSTSKVELPVLSSCLCRHLPEHVFVKEKVINSSPATH
jgi:hypothetical protein